MKKRRSLICPIKKEFNLSYFINRFCADSELSEVLSTLWEMDDNKCYPGKEYEINLQGK